MNVGFISTRFSGTDGVTLETSKWAQVFERNGHACFWFAGELDRDPSAGYLVPEAHFDHEVNHRINAAVVGPTQRPAEISELIHSRRLMLKQHIYRFMQKFHIDMLVAENILSLPMQIPLGLALTEVAAETRIPVIAHHHDFYWERDRYLVNAAGDYIHAAFPPQLHNMAHVVINSTAREELSRRTGIAATVIPNVLDFHQPPVVDMNAGRSFREFIGVKTEDLVFLQPTRVVQRKGIEHAINLVHALGRPNSKLVISHPAGDEGFDYADWLSRYSQTLNVDVIFVDAHLGDPWGTHSIRYPEFSLFDIYPGADFVTYPSLYEGFGNGLLEAIYFKKPVLVNRYATYVRDIEPLGFDMVSIDGFLTNPAVSRVEALLDSPHMRQSMTEHNFNLARQHFSYPALQEQLNVAMAPLMDGRRMLDADMTRPADTGASAPLEGQPISGRDVQWARARN